MIVGMIGCMGGGKDWNAARLVEKGYLRVDFKDALLDMVSDLVGYDVRQEYDWFKEMPIGYRRPTSEFAVHSFAGQAKIFMLPSGLLTGRDLLQRLGTEVMRKRDPDYWVKAWWATVVVRGGTSGRDCVAADVRFENEVRRIQSANNYGAATRFIFCDYRSKRYRNDVDHPSEWLAQALLELRCQDGQDIDYGTLNDAFEIVHQREEAKRCQNQPKSR